MANETHLRILKEGSDVWDRWRKQHPTTIPDLSGADIRGIDLGEANLRDADLNGANLSEANLRDTDFSLAILSNTNLTHANLRFARFDSANLSEANLSYADLGFAVLADALLSDANLSFATLREANFYGATLSKANLSEAYLSGTNFADADLSRTDLSYAILSHAVLSNTNFSGATMVETHLEDLDLRVAKGLESVIHRGPSRISISTLRRSQGAIPEIFLRGVGLDSSSILYTQSFMHSSIQYGTCFICYAHTDDVFAKRLYADLQNEGVCCWLAPHFTNPDLDRSTHSVIDDAIHMYHKLALVLVLSENSVERAWIPIEVGAAGAKERREGYPIVFPLWIDDIALQSTRWWIEQIKRRDYIGDFTQWNDENTYRQALGVLLEVLRGEQDGNDTACLA